jgi:parallel beta-helix repeat protein
VKKYVSSLLALAVSGRQRTCAAKTGQQSQIRSLVEPLEPRLLHSADIAPLVLAATPLGESTQAQPTTVLSHSLSVQTPQNTATELVVIDSKVAEPEILLADIAAQQRTGRNIIVLQVADNEDGIAVTSQVIAELHDQGFQVCAIHIVSHGSDGEFELGNQRVNDAVLRQSTAKFSAWSLALTDDADILIYGCNLASTQSGENFANNLAAITGADVAGNTHNTGDLALGGDWTLDYKTGAINTDLAVSAQSPEQWHHLLTLNPLGLPNQVSSVTLGTQSTGSDIADDSYLSESTGGNKIAVDNVGNYVVAWIDSIALKIRFFNANDTPKLGGEIFLPALNARQVAVAMNGNSESVVVWAQGVGNQSTVFAQQYTATGAPKALPYSIDIGANASKPAVAINDAGEFVVTWQVESLTLGTEIKAQGFSASGLRLGSAITVNQGFTNGDQVRPSVAMRGNIAAITWHDKSSARIAFNTLKIETNSVAIGLVTNADLDLGTLTAQDAPDVAIDSGNKIVIAWQANESGKGHTYFSEFQASSDLTIAPTNIRLQARVNPDTAEAQSLPKVAIANSGEFVIAQQSAAQSLDASGWGIFIRAFSSNGTAIDSSEASLNFTSTKPLYSLANQYASNIAWRNGNLVSAWTSDASGEAKVYSRQAQVTIEHTFVVNTINDIVDSSDGLTSLREAITASNNTSNLDNEPDKIIFNIPGIAANYRLELSNALPAITESVDIDGLTQESFNGAHISIIDQSAATAVFRLLGDYGSGFSSSGSKITGLSIQSVYGSGIQIESANNTILRNTLSYCGQAGISIDGATSLSTTNNTVDTNTIYANAGAGINIANSPANKILNNEIIRNTGNGIQILTLALARDSADNEISGNSISENANGIQLEGIGTRGNKLLGNYIGQSIRSSSEGNLADGVKITGGAASNQIGGTLLGNGNVIAYNGRYGVSVEPVLGLDPTSNSILQNSIFKNANSGIHVPAQEARTPPNFISAVRDDAQTRISLQFLGTPSTYYRIEYFSNTEDGSGGAGTGRLLIDIVDVYTTGLGPTKIDRVLPTALPIGNTLTATVTAFDANSGAFGTTSEFSAPITIGMKRSLAENQIGTFNIAAYTRFAPQPGLTYSLINSGDSAHFTLTPSGLLSLRDPADYETIFTDAGGGNDNQWWAFVNVSNGTYSDTVIHIFEFSDANDSPTINTGQSSTAAQGSIVNFVGANAITVGDPDNSPSALATQLTLTVSAAIDGQPAQSGGRISLVGPESQSVTVTATLAEINSLLATMQLITNPSESRSIRLALSISDNGSGFGSAYAFVNDADHLVAITPVANIAPAISGVQSSVDYIENSGAQAVFGNAVLENADGTTLSSLVINYSLALITAEESLTLPNASASGLTLVHNDTTRTITISGKAPIATYQLLLRSLQYTNGSDAATVSGRVFSVSVNDGVANSNTASTTVAMQYVNDAPTIASLKTLVTPEDRGVIFSLTNAITVNDVDSNQLVLSITVGSGTLRWTGPTGVQPGVRILSSSQIELSGSAAEINQWTALFEFTPPLNFNGMANVQWRLTDNQGATMNKNVPVQVTPVNDLPSLQVNPIEVGQGKSTAIRSTTSMASDIEDAPATLTYELNALPVNGTLEMNGRILTLTSTFTQADIDSGAIRYLHNNGVNASDAFSITVKDSAGAKTPIKTIAVSISIAPVIVIAPGGSGSGSGSGAGAGGDTGTTGGITATPPSPTITPISATDTKSSSGSDVTPSQGQTGNNATSASTSNQTKAISKSTPTGLSNLNGSNSEGASNNGLSAGSNAITTSNNGTTGNIGLAVNKTVQPFALANNAGDTQKIEQSIGGGFLRTRSVAENTEYAAIVRSALSNQAFTEDVQKVRDNSDNKLKFSQNVVASTTAVSATLSIGYVIWLVRGGALLSSLLASIPAWSLVDPLPILGSMGGKEDDPEDDSLDAMIDKAKVNRENAAMAQTGPHPVSLA